MVGAPPDVVLFLRVVASWRRWVMVAVKWPGIYWLRLREDNNSGRGVVMPT